MTATPAPRRNRLAGETSPYLLQHADNPVDWYPWGEEAFAVARATGRPVLLSIGYSACHWCHVMAHESFEDPATAAVMNELFVNVKVDREERPDLDRIHQLAHQLLTRRGGGWPLTMFLAPDDRRPFFGGTYFPPEPRYGMPGFRTLLARVSEYYREHRDEVRGQSQALVDALASIDAPERAATELHDGPLRRLRAELEQRFDSRHGGFSPAPKFPHPGILQRLLRDWRATARSDTPDLTALYMATLTLKRMADGGLQDHLGGGFCRYSVDERWEIPHFEKMLCDNGALLSAYADAALATGDPQFVAVTEATAGFLVREMRDADGGFCSSFDADSEGHEGRFYLWTPEQVRALLEPGDAAAFIAAHGLDAPANFEGAWHLVAARDAAQVAAAEPSLGDENEVSRRLERARSTLLRARSTRVPPGRDDKLLTGWNALAIRGLADAARVLGRDDLAAAAAAALALLQRLHWRDGRLLATSRHGRAHLSAYLDDHALLIDAILALQAVRFDADALAFAIRLADTLLARFEDREHGGFFFTAHDHEALVHRSRTFADDATPSGNAVAIAVLQKLGWLLGEPRYLAAAERALRAGFEGLSRSPLGHVHLATALEDHLHPHGFVILRGDAATVDVVRRDVQRVWRPRLTVLAIPGETEGLPQALAVKRPEGAFTAWLCRGSTCEAPLHEPAALLAALEGAD